MLMARYQLEINTFQTVVEKQKTRTRAGERLEQHTFYCMVPDHRLL